MAQDRAETQQKTGGRLRQHQAMQMMRPRKGAEPTSSVEKPPKAYSKKGAILAEKLRGRIYQSTNYLAALDREITPDGTSRAVLKAMKKFENRYAKKWKGRHLTRPADLERYACWLYLTASRLHEPLLKPYPQITVFKPRGLPWRVVKVNRQIEKSFEPGTQKTRRAWIEQYIPIFDATEDELWSKVLNAYDASSLDDLFDRMKEHYGKGKKASFNLTHIIQHNFKADQKVSRGADKGKLVKDAPISPHLLRHHRIYNWKIERQIPDSAIVLMVGWKDESMLGYYAYMNEKAKGEAQLQAFERYAEGMERKQNANE